MNYASNRFQSLVFCFIGNFEYVLVPVIRNYRSVIWLQTFRGKDSRMSYINPLVMVESISLLFAALFHFSSISSRQYYVMQFFLNPNSCFARQEPLKLEISQNMHRSKFFEMFERMLISLRISVALFKDRSGICQPKE